MPADIRRWSFAVLLSLGGAALIEASQPSLPAFRDVSVQATSSWGAGSTSLVVLPNGNFEARRATIDDLARVAFGFEHDPRPVDWRQGLGISVVNPRGVRRDRYAITAAAGREWTKPDEGQTIPTELRSMLRRLLQERFSLKARVETRVTDVYELRLFAKTRTAGASPAKSAENCLGPFMYGPPWAADRPRCSFKNDGSGIHAGSVTMADFARLLSTNRALRQRPVVDETGLAGRYDLRLIVDLHHPTQLYESVDEFEQRQSSAFRDALKKQLDLELREAKRSIPTLVIESAQSPQVD